MVPMAGVEIEPRKGRRKWQPGPLHPVLSLLGCSSPSGDKPTPGMEGHTQAAQPHTSPGSRRWGHGWLIPGQLAQAMPTSQEPPQGPSSPGAVKTAELGYV